MVAINRVSLRSCGIGWPGSGNSVDGSAACTVHHHLEYLRSRKGSRDVNYATCRNTKSVYTSGPTLTGASDLGRERRRIGRERKRQSSRTCETRNGCTAAGRHLVDRVGARRRTLFLLA